MFKIYSIQKFLTTFSILLFITYAGYGYGAVFNWAQNYTTPIDKIELDSLSNIYSIGWRNQSKISIPFFKVYFESKDNTMAYPR